MYSDFKAIKDVLSLMADAGEAGNEGGKLRGELSSVLGSVWKVYKPHTLQWAVSLYNTDAGNNNEFFIKHLIIVQTQISHNGGLKFKILGSQIICV